MLRKALFQVHWFIGITAGAVLAVVGLTGATLSFEKPILTAINPSVMTVTAHGQRLSAQTLLERASAQLPAAVVTGLTLAHDPATSAVVQLAPPPGQGRGARVYVNPYSGALLGEPRGETFFRTVMGLHRWLLAEPLGKQVVGACTVTLVFLAGSGLYLRWPRRWASARAWFVFDPRLRGRALWWDLHTVVGTWVLPFYLLAALTGLTWSYEWYRNALFDLAGVEQPKRPGGAPAGVQALPGAAPQAAQPAAPPVDADRLWAAFQGAVPAWSVATLRLPGGPGAPAEFEYLDPDPPHSRARSRLVMDAASATVRTHDRYAQRPLRARLAGSLLPLHSGEYFGLGGLVAMMIASALMPLFAITGWMLYLASARAAPRRTCAPARAGARGVRRPASQPVPLPVRPWCWAAPTRARARPSGTGAHRSGECR